VGGRGEIRHHLAGQPRRNPVDLVCLLRQPVLSEHQPARPEGVGFDGVAADLEEARMDLPDGLRPRQNEEFVAAVLALKIVRRQVAVLDRRPHRSVEDEDPVP
jgi:hypothetical protein